MFHAKMALSGGYLGVDVFFVISGYLITSLIIKELQKGTFTFVAFWERRIRRIVPATSVMVVAVLVAGWFLLLPNEYVALGKSAMAFAAIVANFFSGEIPAAILPMERKCLYSILGLWQLKSSFT
jgi:peptidoglycan/LPS O-acetylase OafA/YrhL